MAATAMKEHPILFRGEMVRAILEGKKTQTRRPVKKPLWEPLQERAMAPDCGVWRHADGVSEVRCPYGRPGTKLWVRETWRCHGGREYEYLREPGAIRFRADADAVDYVQAEWRPSIFMPRWACRLELEIVNVRIERLHALTEADAKAEGTPIGAEPITGLKDINLQVNPPVVMSYRIGFLQRFPKMHKQAADWNPWLWVIEFKVAE